MSVVGVTGARPLRVAFVGAGQMAALHLEALRRVTAPSTVVGVHDLRLSSAQALARRAGAPAYRALSALLEQSRPDVVHICTPMGAHFEPAHQALLAGAHVYVEKPFVETGAEAEALFALAHERGRLICAGHQLMRDPAFQTALRRAAALGPIALVDSAFAFSPPRLDPERAPLPALGNQLLDVLPHPLYTLLAALHRLGPPRTAIEIAHVTATPTDVHAVLQMGEVTARLSVSLRARPVASTLTVTGAHGTLTTDFVRSIILGAANEGTTPLEKIANPFLEATQLAWRSAASLARRLAGGSHSPGLVELLQDFYAAAATGGPAPLSIDHLRSATLVYERLARRIRGAVAARITASPTPDTRSSAGPLAVVTGAAGFFGRAITRALARRGFRVRGVGRSESPADPNVHEWVRVDLADQIPANAFAGAAVVVHAAAETAGAFEAHARNTIGVTRSVLRAMARSRARRLIYVSSLSVLRPPHAPWERQTEETPLCTRPEGLGPYTWGKCAAEELVAQAGAAGTVDVRIIRPAALIDWGHPDLPGLLGRRVFGRWHVGLGRPGLPLAVCEVGRAGAVVGWCAQHFSDAPSVVNLLDPAIRDRGRLLASFRGAGWRGRVLWVPISVLAGAVVAARTAAALIRGERPHPIAVWSLLRPRRYDPTIAAALLAAACDDPAPAERAVPRRSRAYA